MQAILITFAILAVCGLGFAIHQYATLPWLGFSQGDQTLSGTITKIEKKYRATAISLTQGLTSNSEQVSGSVTRYVYFPFDTPFLKVGDTIEAETENKIYNLRRISLNWVNTWKRIESVPDGGAITLARIEERNETLG